MESFFSRFRNPLVLIAIVLMQVIALAVQVQRPRNGLDAGADGQTVAKLRGWSIAGVVPVERAMHGSGMKVRGVWDGYVDLRDAQRQNDQLKKDVARLREEQAVFAEDAAQGRRLQALLGFKEKYVTSTVAAQVIGTSGSERSKVLTLDKGAADGLKPDDAVITPDGVVGKLRDVFPHASQLLLLDDTTSGAGVILATTRIRGILRGTATGGVEINNLTPDARIKPGEKVVTSGGDMVYPRGLPVGEIVSITPDPVHQPYTAIVVKPAANLARLEEVLVITGTSSTMPPGTAQDAATAEATAEANQKAADLNAEKLPSLHSPTGADAGSAVGVAGAPAASDDAESQVGIVPGIPNSGLPKPKPVVHPDRFSVGAAGPADLLQPGGSASGLMRDAPKGDPQGGGPQME